MGSLDRGHAADWAARRAGAHRDRRVGGRRSTGRRPGCAGRSPCSTRVAGIRWRPNAARSCWSSATELALPIKVRLEIRAPEELNIGDVGVMEIPARGTRQIQLPANADSSEATSVSIGLATDTDLALGQPITISVHSNAYGKPLFYVTIVARFCWWVWWGAGCGTGSGVSPTRPTPTGPEADDHDRLAASTYEFRRESSEHSGGIDQYRQEDNTDESEPGPPDPDETGPEPADDQPSEDRGDDVTPQRPIPPAGGPGLDPKSSTAGNPDPGRGSRVRGRVRRGTVRPSGTRGFGPAPRATAGPTKPAGPTPSTGPGLSGGTARPPARSAACGRRTGCPAPSADRPPRHARLGAAPDQPPRRPDRLPADPDRTRMQPMRPGPQQIPPGNWQPPPPATTPTPANPRHRRSTAGHRPPHRRHR